VNLALWTDWTEARADWCEDFARTSRTAYRAVDPDPHHLIVLSDQDYHMHCNPLQYGVDYGRVMRHFDRFEIYMAADHRAVGRREMLANARRNIARGLDVAAPKPFQFHTWFTDAIGFEPMSPALLKGLLECAAERGAAAVEVYTFKVYDWRKAPHRKVLVNELPPFRQVSLKYNPRMLRAIGRFAAKLK
jgi:hypothetical protein